MQIVIERSEEFCRRNAIESGIVVDSKLTVEVQPAELSKEAREILYDQSPSFAHSEGLAYNAQFLPTRWSRHGVKPYLVDSLVPTSDEINTAVLSANDKLTEARKKNDVRLSQKAEEAKQKAERQAIADQVHGDTLRQLKEGMATMRNERKILSEALLAMPRDNVRELDNFDEVEEASSCYFPEEEELQ